MSLKKTKKIEISNKLLSWIFGCECEFVKIGKTQKTVYALKKTDIDDKIFSQSINIFEFIHLAKVKAFEGGYRVIEFEDSTGVCAGSKRVKTVSRYKFAKLKFNSKSVLEALEWVAEKVGGEGENIQ